MIRGLLHTYCALSTGRPIHYTLYTVYVSHFRSKISWMKCHSDSLWKTFIAFLLQLKSMFPNEINGNDLKRSRFILYSGNEYETTMTGWLLLSNLINELQYIWNLNGIKFFENVKFKIWKKSANMNVVQGIFDG